MILNKHAGLQRKKLKAWSVLIFFGGLVEANSISMRALQLKSSILTGREPNRITAKPVMHGCAIKSEWRFRFSLMVVYDQFSDKQHFIVRP